MPYDPRKHHRHTIRLRHYDYTLSGAYFVTICTHQRHHTFGMIYDGEMWLNRYGNIVVDCWRAIPDHFTNANIDAFVVMPDHFHGIVWITDKNQNVTPSVGTWHAMSLRDRHTLKLRQFSKPIPKSLSTIIGSFKSAVTKHINIHRDTPGAPTWQKRFYEHIIRDVDDLNHHREYIWQNPSRWSHSQRG